MQQDHITQEPLITIVTVCYNAETTLEQTIHSILNQTYQNIEYIIIDGASTDNTIEIIKKYEDQLDYWISEPDEGIYFAMNKAIKKARGTWINFMNAGDTFANNTIIEKIYSQLEDRTELFYGDHICNENICNVTSRIITRSMPCCHQSLFVQTALMKQYPYNTFYTISADYDFILNMYKLGKKFQYIKEPVARYLRNGFSDQNTTRWYLETLTVLMNHNIDLDEIIQSPAYNLIENKKFTQLQIKTDILEKKLNFINNLLSIIFSIKSYLNPIKILKTYKSLYQFYKSSSK